MLIAFSSNGGFVSVRVLRIDATAKFTRKKNLVIK